MTVHIPIAAGAPLLDFNSAYARVNQWRGHMVENFARAEQAVTDALVVLNATDAVVKGPKFPHFVGQRYARLEAFLAVSDPPSAQRKTAHIALSQFRKHEDLRAMLCHGVTKVALECAGRWVAIMTLVAFKAGEAQTAQMTMVEDDAKQRLDHLIHDRKRLCAALGQVRRESTKRA